MSDLTLEFCLYFNFNVFLKTKDRHVFDTKNNLNFILAFNMVTSLIYLCLQFFLLINLSESNSLIGSECNLKRSGKGSCVDYKNCNILVNKLKNREIEIKDVIFCNNYGLVCCPLIVSSNSDLSPPSNLSIKTRIRISEESKLDVCKNILEVVY